MKTPAKVIFSFLLMLIVTGVCTAFQNKKPAAAKYSFPYKAAGLSKRDAAAHLLSRFTYGANAENIDEVVKMGLENWFQQQLNGGIEDTNLDQMLKRYEDINQSNTEVENKYPRTAQVVRMAIKDGFIHKDSVNKVDQAAYRRQLKAYMDSKGFKPQQELYRQFFNQKILRATYTNNQLQELLTDFWFNHFNVSLTKNQCAMFVPAYERDVIRPNVTGKFQTLLVATAKSPAMLMYLDNFLSSGQNAQTRTKKKSVGLNENYAREVMELHTLGVDGGYTQSDVTQAARILTGWTIAPMGENGYGSAAKGLMNRLGPAAFEKRGFVHEGDFLFLPTRHDLGEKTVLGRHFPANGGYDEGLELLTMLAKHPSTAKFISKKIAARFVNDNPSAVLVDKMAKTFAKADGDIKQVMIAMVTAPEFWSKEVMREKTKSPFEFAISAVRSLNAVINQPYQLYTWINKMGQRLYHYQAPTGFPDRGQYWINTGSLLSRMNFGLALAAQRIPGIKINLLSLNNDHEPESAEAALLTYSKLIMPERNLQETVKRLNPMVNEPALMTKVERAAAKANPVLEMETAMDEEPKVPNSAMLAQVVGVIIGSPEFQRK